jgi:hypothetical protein
MLLLIGEKEYLTNSEKNVTFRVMKNLRINTENAYHEYFETNFFDHINRFEPKSLRTFTVITNSRS